MHVVDFTEFVSINLKDFVHVVDFIEFVSINLKDFVHVVDFIEFVPISLAGIGLYVAMVSKHYRWNRWKRSNFK